LPKCKFPSTDYYDYEINNTVEFNCQEEPLDSGFCIFHDNDYLQDRTDNEEHKRKVLDRLKNKVNHAISNNDSLLCIGFQLPDFSLSDLRSISKEFTKSVYFNGSRFFGKADFFRAKFQGGADFKEVNFEGPAVFDEANFQGGLEFIRTKFQGGASFFEAKFQGEVNFVEAKFQGGADFSSATFKGKADFPRATFEGETDFVSAKFQGITCFDEAKFQGITKFGFAEFKTSSFGAANFQGRLWFNLATFQGSVNFHFAYFQEITKFASVTFHSIADFSSATFKGEADFTGATFEEEADFLGCYFYSATIFSGEFNGVAKFNYGLFGGRDKTFFYIENLSNVSFMNTDLTGVRFSDKARWGGGEENTREDKFKIIDERLLEEKIKEKDSHTMKDFNLGSIKAVYRSLRENYEYRMRYDEAGHFFIREMELKRKYREVPSKEVENSLEIKQNNWLRRNLFSLTGWYYHLSRYGESL
jgi:uncharacterized protein YjbI with pentapeptide repeats